MTTIYVDSKRAWCTVAGGFIANFILGGLAKSYGIILEAYQDEFQAPTAYFTLTGGILYMLMFILSLPNHFIVERIGNRAVVMVGGIGSCISLLVAAAAPSITVWALAIGGGLGFSFSCVYFNIFAVVGQCFRKKLGLANGLSVAGVSVGQMAFPSLVTHFLEEYGVRAGTIVMAAFSLNICVTAVLMPKRVVDPEAECYSQGCSESAADLKVVASISLIEEEEEKEVIQPKKPVDDEEVTFPSHQSSVESSSSNLAGRAQQRLAVALLVVYILGKVFADNGDVGISFIAPPYGTQMGFSSKMTSLAIAVAGVVDLISRLGFGWLTDQPFCTGKRGVFLAVTWIVEAANAVAFGQLINVPWALDTGYVKLVQWGHQPSTALYVGFFMCFAIHGVCSGTAMTQMVVVLSDWVGPQRLAKSLAIMMLVLGIVYVPAQALVGYLRDLTGTYAWSMRLCGLWLLLAGMIFLLELPLRRWILGKARSLTLTTRKFSEGRVIEDKPSADKFSGNGLCSKSPLLQMKPVGGAGDTSFTVCSVTSEVGLVASLPNSLDEFSSATSASLPGLPSCNA